MPTVPTRAGWLAFDELGAGPGLLLLPAAAHDRHDWDGVRPALAERFRTIALDWPGHGDSPVPPPPWRASAATFADAVEDVVDALDLAPVAVVGNAVGGFAAARLAIRRPRAVSALVLVDSGGFDGPTLRSRAFCAAMGRPWFLRAIYPWLAAHYLHARDGAAVRIRDAAVDAARRPGTTEILTGLWRSFSGPGHDLRADAGGISAPTLLVWGVHDPVLPPRLGRRVAAAIPGARLIVLDAGHVPFADRPEAFLAAVLPFLEPTHRRAPHRSGREG
jgi:pimeloyl-ACP methyl ester carboxylesterase